MGVVLIMQSICLGNSVSVTNWDDDDIPYDKLLFAGTHNSAVNLGARTLLRPKDAVGGHYPSEAHSDYQYGVMDQRLSVRDQLEQGVRVLDFEVASLDGTGWQCESNASFNDPNFTTDGKVWNRSG